MTTNRLSLPEPISGGILLSYKCSSACRHCMYACSPSWKADWMADRDLKGILAELAGKIHGGLGVGINYGLHFTGGEPFLNFSLLLKAARVTHELQIPSTFVETNCFWCTDDEETREKLAQLKEAGLHGVLISVNPFILEQVPFERTERAVRMGEEIFSGNVIIYQEFFHEQFKRLKIQGSLPFEEYLQRAGPSSLRYVELLPMGRTCYRLRHLYRRCSAEYFFGESCREELMRDWHVHIDNYCNYMTGYCGGISLGDARNLDSLCSGIDLENKPILNALAKNLRNLCEFATREFGYEVSPEGYISKCHLCVDIRKHLAKQTGQFGELKPREFYDHLE